MECKLLKMNSYEPTHTKFFKLFKNDLTNKRLYKPFPLKYIPAFAENRNNLNLLQILASCKSITSFAISAILPPPRHLDCYE